tara:strand:- start:642 stop:959 length:318 start_codon:yes stop_codon:yes gene_type:complete
MAYKGSSTFVIPRPVLYKDGVTAAGITGAGITLLKTSTSFQIITNATGGTQDMTLPAAKNGLYFWVKNVAASTGNVTIKLASGTLVSTVTPGEIMMVISDGTNWH